MNGRQCNIQTSETKQVVCVRSCRLKCAFVRSPERPLVISPADMFSCWHQWCGSGCRSRSRCICQNDCCCHFWWSLHFQWPEWQMKTTNVKTHTAIWSDNVLKCVIHFDRASGVAVHFTFWSKTTELKRLFKLSGNTTTTEWIAISPVFMRRCGEAESTRKQQRRYSDSETVASFIH